MFQLTCIQVVFVWNSKSHRIEVQCATSPMIVNNYEVKCWPITNSFECNIRRRRYTFNQRTEDIFCCHTKILPMAMRCDVCVCVSANTGFVIIGGDSRTNRANIFRCELQNAQTQREREWEWERKWISISINSHAMQWTVTAAVVAVCFRIFQGKCVRMHTCTVHIHWKSILHIEYISKKNSPKENTKKFERASGSGRNVFFKTIRNRHVWMRRAMTPACLLIRN